MKKSRMYMFSWLSRKELTKLGFTLKEIYAAFSELYEEGKIKGNWGLYIEKWFENEPKYVRHEFLKYGTHTFTEHKGEWERRVLKSASLYRIPYTILDSEQPKVLRRCLEIKFSWFKDFKWDIYSLRSGGSQDIYMKTASGHSLYVPISAIMESDWSIIKERMISYWGWYYSKRPGYFTEYCSEVLVSDEALRLKEALKNELL